MMRYIKKVIYLLFCCLQISHVFCEKVLINIDRIVRELDTDASDIPLCDISAWANQLSNACKCCLFKRVPKIGSGPGQKTVEQIVNECISKNYCTQKLIDSFKEEAAREQLSMVESAKRLALDLKTALYQLYNTSVVIKKIGKEGIAFDSKGNLTEEGVKTLLKKAYQEGKLPYKDFESAACIEVQDIFAQEKGRGTVQLFLITSKCSGKFHSYILKGVPQYFEPKNLAKLFEFKQLDDLIWPNYVKNYPSLAIPFVFFQYNDHYLSLAPRAQGRELSKIISDYVVNPTQKNKKQIEQAYFDIGYAISKFHQRFMQNKNSILGPTVVHGSFHYRNIFYDIVTHQVILIDNLKLAASFEKKQLPIVDIAYLLFLPSMSPKELIHKIKLDFLLELTVVPFLKGYISAYSKKDWPILFAKLVEEIKKFNLGKKDVIYNKYKNVMDKQFEIVKQFVQDSQPTLESSLTKLQHSLSALTKLLSIKLVP